MGDIAVGDVAVGKLVVDDVAVVAIGGVGDVFTVFAGDIVVGVGSQGIAALGALQRHFCKNVYVLLLWGFFFQATTTTTTFVIASPNKTTTTTWATTAIPAVNFNQRNESRFFFKLKTAVSYCRLFFEHRLRSYRRFFSDTLISSKR